MSVPPKPCVILGFPRSGTTLLARLLDAHSQISCPPETHLMAAAARFLSEQTAVEGPPIGVLSGLAFLGLDAEQVMTPLRDLVFGLERKVAGEKPVWIEKTGVDIFHLEILEELLSGHARFIVLVRHPLDVIASNLDLAEAMGAPLADLARLTRSYDDPFEGMARAWIDRASALNGLIARQGADVYRLSYEELTANPAAVLDGLLGWIGVRPADGTALAETALAQGPRVGLGDFRINATVGIRLPEKNGWRKRLPRAATSRIVPILADAMVEQGYAVPKVPKLPDREDAVRQFQMAAQIKRAQAED